MKTIKKSMSLMALIILMGASATLLSCSSDDETQLTAGTATNDGLPAGAERTAVMHLTGERPQYSDAATRATSSSWDDGAMLYLRFHVADGTSPIVYGKAVYSAASSSWNISYYGPLTEGSTQQCEVFHFTDATHIDNYNVTLTPTSCAYSDPNATYKAEGGELFVNANLAPMTARLRIKGTTGKSVTVANLVYNTAFSLTDNAFTTAPSELSFTFDNTGHTPYMYCMLPESNKITLTDEFYHYTKTINPADLTAGESGCLTMPTRTDNDGWDLEVFYPDDAVDMGCSVRWRKMNIGADDEYAAGTYRSWGDTYGTNTSTESDYNSSVHNIAGNPNYDIATRTLGERWAIPTKEQWQELMDNCTWTSSYDQSRHIYIYTVTAKNGNTINLPLYSIWNEIPSDGYYWTATEYDPQTGEYGTEYGDTYAYLWLGSFSNTVLSYHTIGPKYTRVQIRPVLVK